MDDSIILQHRTGVQLNQRTGPDAELPIVPELSTILEAQRAAVETDLSGPAGGELHAHVIDGGAGGIVERIEFQNLGCVQLASAGRGGSIVEANTINVQL